MNLDASDWDVERSFGELKMRMLHVGRRIGGELLGATLFELDPGLKGINHFHHGNEEWVVVLEGTPVLRTPSGASTLERGDVVAFRRGPDGAHALSNESDVPCRFLVLSSMRHPDVVEYPDAGVIGAFAGDAPTAGRDAPFEAFFPADANVDYSEIVRRG
jgi:uncharacterized cupin superfamily protein